MSRFSGYCFRRFSGRLGNRGAATSNKIKSVNMKMDDRAPRVTRQRSGEVRNKRDKPKIRPSFAPRVNFKDSSTLFCSREILHPSQELSGGRKNEKKKKKRNNKKEQPVSFSSYGTLLAQIPASIGKSLKSSRRRKKKNKATYSSSLPPTSLPSTLDDSFNTTSTSQSQSSTTLDEFSFMSYRFPITTKTKKLLITKSPNSRDIAIENSHGKMIGSMDYSLAKELKTMILKDATGTPCALIEKAQHDAILFGPIRFRVYCDKPAFDGQEPTTTAEDNGLLITGSYLWAEIKNTGSVDGTFVMKRYTSSESSSYEKYVAKRFGTLFSKSKSKGFTFLDSNKNECAKMFSLNKNGAKGILIAANRDMCLMLAFCAVVDEMVENFLI